MQSNTLRSGFALLIGRPSSGKSTLVNALCGHKVSIVSSIPQTTRNTIRGIVNDPRGQVVLLDTPGFHTSTKKLNLKLRDVVTGSLSEADLLLYLVDSTRPPGEEEQAIAEMVVAAQLPVVIIITKTDVEGHADIGRARRFLSAAGFDTPTVIESSGLDRTPPPADSGLQAVRDTIFGLLPEGEPWYPEDYYTDQSPEFRIAEIVREQAIIRTREEVPHALFVEIADLEQKEKGIWARLFILVERNSQQGIVVGHKGETITAIRRASEQILSEIFPVPVRLSIQVKVRSKWRHDDRILKRLIY